MSGYAKKHRLPRATLLQSQVCTSVGRKISQTGRCELCQRQVTVLTRHHLIPRTRHANKRNQREFTRADVKQRIAWLCRPCHNHIHALFTEKTLERDFNTMESLAAHPEVSRFVAWIRKKPDAFRPANQPSAGKRGKQKRSAAKW